MARSDRTGPGHVLQDTKRLAALAATGLDAVADPDLEPFARLVARLLDVPVALVSLVDDARQFFPAQVGLAEPVATRRETPLSHSFCQHVVRSGAPLIVPDAADDPLVCANLAVPDLGVCGYAGMPLVDGDGHVLGSLCAIDTSPRQWTDDELDTLRDLAAACSSELQLRIAAARAAAARDQAEQARAEAEHARRRAEQAGARLALLAQVTRATTSTLEADVALQRLARVVVPTLGDWCTVDLLDGDLVRTVAVEPAVHRDTAGLSLRQQLRVDPTGTPARDGLNAVLAGTRPMAVVDVSRAATSDGATETVASATASAANAPEDPVGQVHAARLDKLGGRRALIAGLVDRNGDSLGAVTFGREIDQPWTDNERLLISEIVRRVSLTVENARLYRTQRRASETLQSSLLTRLPDSPGLQVSARYRPALEGVDVGGDWYDAFPLYDGATAVVIGDVMGHDLSAAARMGQLRNMLRTLAHDRPGPPSELLGRLDRASEGLGVDALATCVLGVLTPSDAVDGSWRLRWSSAGHLPPVVLSSDGRCTLLDGVNDLMLGIDPDIARHDVDVDLHPGDTVILVTDGLVESRDGSLDDGLTHLRRNALRAASGDLDDLCEELVSSMSTRVNNDDVAIIAVRVLGRHDES